MLFGTYATFPPISKPPFDLIHAHDDDDDAHTKSRKAQRGEEREAREKQRAAGEEKEYVPGVRGRNVTECIQIAQVQGSYDMRKLENELLILGQQRQLAEGLMNSSARRAQCTSGIYTKEVQLAAAESELKYFNELQGIMVRFDALQKEITQQNSGDVVFLGSKRPATSSTDTSVVKKEKAGEHHLQSPASSFSKSMVLKGKGGDGHSPSSSLSSKGNAATEVIDAADTQPEKSPSSSLASPVAFL
jgi:hypothetical protein